MSINQNMNGNRGGFSTVASADGVEDFITKEEVARRLKKTTRTIENWQRRGYIPFVKVQQSVLFRWSSVVAELERKFGVGLPRNN